ncbi:MAG: hypothetical protein RI907_2141 [Pseudomonadota bacterium]|jgi:hypothetical protein
MPSGVTLVLADTESHVLAHNAIEHSIRQFPFDEVLVFTDRPELWPQWRTCRIDTIRHIDAYNTLMIKTVPHLVRTDHFVVAQFDGFVLHGQAFDPAFYECDYIGAVWPEWPVFNVGNGGFSWRSRKLALAVAEMADFWRPGEPEDVFIARTLRVALESRHGCRFADVERAHAFSYEQLLPTKPTFGFHGLMHLPHVYRDQLDYLVANLPQRVIDKRLPLLMLGAQLLDEAQRVQLVRLCAERVAQAGAQGPIAAAAPAVAMTG